VTFFRKTTGKRAIPSYFSVADGTDTGIISNIKKYPCTISYIFLCHYIHGGRGYR